MAPLGEDVEAEHALPRLYDVFEEADLLLGIGLLRRLRLLYELLER